MSNVVSFTGRVGRDAEVKYLPSGQAVLNVAVGNSVGFGDNKQTIWFNCAIWGKRAEGQLVDYLKKGVLVFVSGEMSLREYQAKDGTTKANVELNVNVLDLLSNPQTQQSRPEQQTQQPRQSMSPPQYDWFDDIPF